MPAGLKQRVSGRTDANGRVLLPALARESLYSVSVTTEKYGTQIQRFTVDPSTLAERTIRLRPVGRIEGRVIADKPEWVPGLRCTITTAKSWKRGETRDPGSPSARRLRRSDKLTSKAISQFPHLPKDRFRDLSVWS